MARAKYEQWLKPENLLKITNWAANGCTEAQIAQNMGVAYSTFRLWRDKYSAISAAIKEGQMLAVEAVENALFKSAVGRVTVEETIEEFRGEMQDGKPIDGTLTRRTTVKSVPPNVSAQIFYLKNRIPDRYSDRRVMEVEQSVPTINLGVEPKRAKK